MRKISRVVVREMTTLTNEEMAMITGGDDSTSTTTGGDKLCSSANVGQSCYYDKEKDLWGICTLIKHEELGYISYRYVCYYAG